MDKEKAYLESYKGKNFSVEQTGKRWKWQVHGKSKIGFAATQQTAKQKAREFIDSLKKSAV